MGTIAEVAQKVGERYNKIKVHEANGNVAAGGWGIRARDKAPGFEGDSSVCLTYPLQSNSLIKYVAFRVLLASGTPDADYVVFSIWKHSPGALLLTKVSRVVINKAMLEANYGTGTTFTSATEFTIMLDSYDQVFLEAISGVTYYAAVYADGCTLEYDDDGTVDGAYFKSGVDISDGNDTYRISNLTKNDFAISFEAFSEPDSWNRLLVGGAISEENDDWQTAGFCTASGWPHHARIYDGTAAVADSVTSGDYILLDLGAGIAPVSPWPGIAPVSPWPGIAPVSSWPGPAGSGLSLGQDEFPDYTAYGVRALHELQISAVVAATGSLDVLISAEDTSSAPAYGYERILSLPPATYAPYRLLIPSIARWVKIVNSGASVSVAISDFKVYQIQYGIVDGNFPVDVLRVSHNVWVENYPTTVSVRRLTMGNMAGGESLPGKPFTNRENLD